MEIYYPKIITDIHDHSREVRKEAEQIKNQIINGLLIDEAPVRRKEEWITIDKKTSKDLDDWIWAKKTENGYSIYISIADVAEIIKPWTILDLNAFSKPTSIYWSSYVYHMFPSEVSTDICSLNDQTKRKSITTRIDLNHNFLPQSSEIYESEFINKKRFDYSEFNKQFNNSTEKYHEDLNSFHKIAKWLYKNRIWEGAQTDFKEKVTLKIENNNNEKNDNSIASFIIQEFMLLNNIENAKINFKEKINWIFRLHMPDLRWQITTNKWIERAFYNYRYWHHYWLWENFYWHFTSPIRRYADLINHRQQKAWLRHKQNPQKFSKEIYNINEIRKIIIHINTSIEQILTLEKEHNNQITEKRTGRFIKKLETDNYSSLSSVSEIKFSKMIQYFILNPKYFNIDIINEEIIYRIENDLLLQKDIWRIKSIENTVKEWDFFKELIDNKNEININY